MNTIPTFEEFVIGEITETLQGLNYTDGMRYLRGARDYYRYENAAIYRVICGLIDTINGK